MTKRRQNAKVSPLSKKGKGKQKRQRFGQDWGDMSPALVERRPKAKYREMGKSPALFKMVERRPKATYKEMRAARWRQKCCSKSRQDGKCSSDRISMLPDELLSFILSHITLKEQIATSILSRRWRYLWTLTTSLEFDGIDSLLSTVSIDSLLAINWNVVTKNKTLIEKAKLDFVSWVSHVIASHKGSTIEDFKVYFDLGNKYEGYLNEWLRYALACKVQRLELNLNATHMRLEDDYYVFPDRFFSHIDEEVGCNPNPNPNPIHIKQLKTISLNCVGVDGKALELLLHNCPFLEDLSVSKSSKLLSLRVTGPFPSLKRLEISECFKFESLEICDVINLVCFKYVGRWIRFLFRNLPMLAHVSVSTPMFEYMKGNIAQFSSILEPLEIFTLHTEKKLLRSWSMTSVLLPVEMSNLKQLEVMLPPILVDGDESLLWLTDLIQSAPRLQKFVVESRRKDARFPKRELQRKKIENSAYPLLEEVEFSGFCGCPSDLEFLFHFVDNAAALKKILINKKKTHEILHVYKFFFNHNKIYKDVRDQLEKQIALEKPWIKVQF